MSAPLPKRQRSAAAAAEPAPPVTEEEAAQLAWLTSLPPLFNEADYLHTPGARRAGWSTQNCPYTDEKGQPEDSITFEVIPPAKLVRLRTGSHALACYNIDTLQKWIASKGGPESVIYDPAFHLLMPEDMVQSLWQDVRGTPPPPPPPPPPPLPPPLPRAARRHVAPVVTMAAPPPWIPPESPSEHLREVWRSLTGYYTRPTPMPPPPPRPPPPPPPPPAAHRRAPTPPVVMAAPPPWIPPETFSERVQDLLRSLRPTR